MKLSAVENAPELQGLYVYDFGDWTAVGCTAAEIAVLLEDKNRNSGTIYRIHRAYPDGRMELKGVSAERWQLESGIFFYRDDLDAARRDFDTLAALADTDPPPCRAFLQLADRTAAQADGRYLTAAIYPSEFEDDVAAWLLKGGFAGGDRVEGGISHVSDFYAEQKDVLNRRQLWSRASSPARLPGEILAERQAG
jgi:hypothetical protein